MQPPLSVQADRGTVRNYPTQWRYFCSTTIELSPSSQKVAPPFRSTRIWTTWPPALGTVINDCRTAPVHSRASFGRELHNANVVPLFGFAWTPSTRTVTLTHEFSAPAETHSAL